MLTDVLIHMFLPCCALAQEACQVRHERCRLGKVAPSDMEMSEEARQVESNVAPKETEEKEAESTEPTKKESDRSVKKTPSAERA